MPNMKTSNQFPDPLVAAPAGTQSRKPGNRASPLLDSRFRGNERRKAAAVPPVCDNDEPMPQDIDEFRRQIVRKIQTMRRMYRRCRAPICRRIKRCAGPPCAASTIFRRASDARKAGGRKAALQRALQRRLQQARDEQG